MLKGRLSLFTGPPVMLGAAAALITGYFFVTRKVLSNEPKVRKD
jgi:hypothetical protein